MTDEPIYQGLQTVFRCIIEDASIVRKPGTTAYLECADSFSHVNIVVAAEQAFGSAFSKGEAETRANVSDLVSTIRSTNPQRSAG